MGFIQDIKAAIRYSRLANTGGKFLTTDDTGLLILVDVGEALKTGLSGYTSADINADGSLVIKNADKPKIVNKSLLSARLDNVPIPGVLFYPATNLVEGFGNYVGAAGAITLTFI